MPAAPTFDDLGTPLREVEFVVVDLETTGGPPGAHAITEIGAVRVRGGEVLAEFSTLVNPGVPIPPMITVLTGITTAMVLEAPAIEEVLPSFLEWAGFGRGSVLVAHNARFDAGFLKAACHDLDRAWPSPPVVDTLALARRVVTRDETRNMKLASLAALFRATVEPNHRALADAQATVDVLHGLLDRLGPLGVTHLEDLATAADPVPPARRRKSVMAAGLPTGPGVYQFLGPSGEVLYVGTATNLRARVRSYFTAAEKRRRIGEMVDLATDVRAIPCASVIEARVRELRLIDQHQPAYNRRSRGATKRAWVKLTNEAHPRLSIVRTLPTEDLARAIGPFPSRRAAERAMEVIAETTGLRTCTSRLPREPRPTARACALLDLGTCPAPCVNPDASARHDRAVESARRLLSGDLADGVDAVRVRMAELSDALRYEEAGMVRDRLRALVDGARRAERLRLLVGTREIVATRPGPHGWELVVIRHGRLAAAGTLEPGADPWGTVERLRVFAEDVPAPRTVNEHTIAEETDLLVDWLRSPGARLVLTTDDVPLAYPVRGGHAQDLPPIRGAREVRDEA